MTAGGVTAAGAVPTPRAADGDARDVDTFGWDTVFAIPIGDVNKAIADHHSSPAGFHYADPGAGLTCGGTFGDWRVVPGGDGGNIRLALPLRDVRGTAPQQFTCPPCTAIIEVKLHYLPQPAEPGKPVPHHLTVRSTSTDDTDPVASLVTMEWPNGKPSPPVLAYLVEGAIAGWCGDNLAEFSHVFATVDLNEYEDTGDFAFCKPTYLSYAYSEHLDGSNGVLGVLCMTGGRSPGSNAQQMANGAIPAGTRAGFTIARARLLRDMMLPALPLAWKNSKITDFTVSPDERTIALLDGRSIRLPDVRHDGSSYTPYLRRFTLSVQDAQIRVESRTEMDLGLGVTGWCEAVHTYTIGLGRNANGQQTLVYEAAGDPVSTHGTEQSSATTAILIVLGIVVMAVLAILTDGVALVVAGMVAGLLLGVAGVSPEIIALVDGDQTPGIDLLVFNATNPITWPDSRDFTLEKVALHSALQLGGDPNFV